MVSVHLLKSDLNLPTYREAFSGLKAYTDILKTPPIISPFLHSNNISQILAYQSRNANISIFMSFLQDVEKNKFLKYLKEKGDQEVWDYVLLNSLSVMQKMDIDKIEEIFGQVREKKTAKKEILNLGNGACVTGYKVKCSDLVDVLEKVLSQKAQLQPSKIQCSQSANAPMEDIKPMSSQGMPQKSRAETNYRRSGLDRFNARYGFKR